MRNQGCYQGHMTQGEGQG